MSILLSHETIIILLIKEVLICLNSACVKIRSSYCVVLLQFYTSVKMWWTCWHNAKMFFIHETEGFSLFWVFSLLAYADNTEWVSDTPKSLWKKIVDEVEDYYGYTLEWYESVLVFFYLLFYFITLHLTLIICFENNLKICLYSNFKKKNIATD